VISPNPVKIDFSISQQFQAIDKSESRFIAEKIYKSAENGGFNVED